MKKFILAIGIMISISTYSANCSAQQKNYADTVYDSKRRLIAVYNLANIPEMEGCGFKEFQQGIITQVNYSDDVITGFTLKFINGRRQHFEIDEGDFGKPDKGNLYKLIAENRKIRVSYFICGSGGFHHVQHIENGSVPVNLKIRQRFIHTENREDNRNSQPSSNSLKTTPIANQQVVIEPRSYAWFTFGLGARNTTIAVDGYFRAQGGSGNDIKAYILDKEGFENFKNGHNAPTFYNSGQVTVSKIRAIINQPNTYYLVFDNRFSFSSNKVVTVTANMIYK